MGAVEPRTLVKLPGAAWVSTDAPNVLTKNPRSALAQVACPGTPWKVPGMHWAWRVAPALPTKNPGLAERQLDCPARG